MTSTITVAWHENLRLSYLYTGKAGPAVLLLHGLGAFKELWWSTLLALAPHYRVYAPDFPGHGGSPTVERADMPSLAALVSAFCDSLGLEAITLVGHSMGGSVAVELALARPELVTRLVLVDAAVDIHHMPAFLHNYVHSQASWPGLRFSLAVGKVIAPLGRRIPHEHGGGVLLPWFRRISYQVSHNPEMMHRMLHELFAAKAGERLGTIRQPTLVISGQFDGLVPPAHSRRTAQAIPNAQFVLIPNALHNPMDEQPAAFEQALLKFLANSK
jgi:3-oxoadipate enol-lactonase